MVLHCHHIPTSSLGTGDEKVLVDWLESEGIDHPDIDALVLQGLVGLHGLLESHSSTHDGHLVSSRLPYNLEKMERKKQ